MARESSEVLGGHFATSPASAAFPIAGLGGFWRVDPVGPHEDGSDLQCVTVEDPRLALDCHRLILDRGLRQGRNSGKSHRHDSQK